MVSQSQATGSTASKPHPLMSAASELRTVDVAAPLTDDDNPFIATSEDEAHSQEASNTDNEDTEGSESYEDSDSDMNVPHMDGVRKLSEIQFPAYVDGLPEPRTKCARDVDVGDFSQKIAVRSRKTDDDPLRTPQKEDCAPYTIKELNCGAPCEIEADSERTPQKTIKRLRSDSDYLTPTRPTVQNSSPTKAPKGGALSVQMASFYSRKFTTPSKVRKSPKIKQKEECEGASLKAPPFHFSTKKSEDSRALLAAATISDTHSNNTSV